MEYLIDKLAQKFNIRPNRVKKTALLIDTDNSISFIVRYSKDITGILSDVLLREG